jgi:hypothetical protein
MVTEGEPKIRCPTHSLGIWTNGALIAETLIRKEGEGRERKREKIKERERERESREHRH